MQWDGIGELRKDFGKRRLFFRRAATSTVNLAIPSVRMCVRTHVRLSDMTVPPSSAPGTDTGVRKGGPFSSVSFFL